MNKKSNSTLKT